MRAKLEKLLRERYGIGLTDLYPAIMIIIVVGLLLGVGVFVLDQFAGQMTNGSTAQTVVTKVVDAFSDFVPWIATILLIIAAAIVLGIVIRNFGATGNRV